MTVGSEANDRADVLVIGGCTGGIVPKQLAEDGFSVVCLKQGEWVDQAELPGDKPGFELAEGKWWSANPNVPARPEDYPCEVSESDADVKMYNGVASSSILYAGCWSRFLPSDFRVRTLDSVADDWSPTSRIGDDPCSSVVDRFGRAHDVENLFIVDGSVFVTSSGLNPTSTICALARRRGRCMAEKARLLKVAT